MSQRIAAYRVKDRPILVLVGGPAGRPIGGVSVFVVDRNGHSPRCLIAHLDHAVRVEKREGRCFYQFPRLAKKEHDEDQRPAIKNEINVDSYDTIYIGYPMWWYTFPMIVYTFFDKYDFSGKTIIPFNTHMGSGNGGTYDTIRKLEPKAKVLTGLPVEMRDAENGPAKAVEKRLTSLR